MDKTKKHIGSVLEVANNEFIGNFYGRMWGLNDTVNKTKIEANIFK